MMSCLRKISRDQPFMLHCLLVVCALWGLLPMRAECVDYLSNSVFWNGGSIGFETNLIINSGAESLTTQSSSVSIVSDWKATGGAGAHYYKGGGDYLSPTSPGPADRGTYFFFGGSSSSQSTLSQQIDLSFLNWDTINTYQFDASAWIGGYAGQGDRATVTFNFLSGVSSLQVISLGPVSSQERGNTSKLLLKTATGDIPWGADSVVVTMTFDRFVGAYSDGYVDNLSFVAHSPVIPEPATAGIIAAFVALAFCVVARRKKQPERARFLSRLFSSE